ncbi:unnamed protein product (mitochondrion) [Plasmodiophora brassicae]|uniref:Uncharacterized protein n=1 Tax=Plasmodiophora brassicae TaxID=37360 RepID=A0A3P3Y9A1_PLABS|nr:unnamed protein product [Plasmodiophora brassicae]
MTQYMTNEFNRVKGSANRQHLVISEVLQANPPHTTRMTIAHLGTVFCLDPLMTGEFRLENTTEFIKVCKNRHQVYRPQEFDSHLRAYFTLQMWAQFTDLGCQVFGDWVLNLICADRQITEEDAGEQKYVHRDRLKPTLTLMVPHAAKLAELMAELRKKTEEKSRDTSPELISLEVVHEFATSFMSGVLSMMGDIGYTTDMITEEELSELREAI